MNKKSLKEQSVEQLESVKKAYTIILAIESVVIMSLFGYFIYQFATDSWNGNNILFAVPIIMMGGMIPLFIMRQSVVNELDSRR